MVAPRTKFELTQIMIPAVGGSLTIEYSFSFQHGFGEMESISIREREAAEGNSVDGWLNRRAEHPNKGSWIPLGESFALSL